MLGEMELASIRRDLSQISGKDFGSGKILSEEMLYHQMVEPELNTDWEHYLRDYSLISRNISFIEKQLIDEGYSGTDVHSQAIFNYYNELIGPIPTVRNRYAKFDIPPITINDVEVRSIAISSDNVYFMGSKMFGVKNILSERQIGRLIVPSEFKASIDNFWQWLLATIWLISHDSVAKGRLYKETFTIGDKSYSCMRLGSMMFIDGRPIGDSWFKLIFNDVEFMNRG